MFKLIADQLSFPESPTWSESDQCLYFVEWTGDAVRVLKENGCPVLFKTEELGGPSGLGQNGAGDLWVCLYDGLKVVKYSRTGQVLDEIEDFQGEPFRGPNDLTLDTDGGVYFTDGGNNGEDWESGRPAGAVFYYSPDRRLSLVDAGICFPNGIALSLDEKRLYVNEHRQNRTLLYALQEPGAPDNRSVFFKLDDHVLLGEELAFELGPDGMSVDPDGNLWIAHYGGGKVIQVNSEAELLKSLRLPRGRKPTSTCFVSSERRLYVTEAEIGLLYSIDLSEP